MDRRRSCSSHTADEGMAGEDGSLDGISRHRGAARSSRTGMGRAEDGLGCCHRYRESTCSLIPAFGRGSVSGVATFTDPQFYGDSWAEVYDETTDYLDTDGAVEFLSGLAKDGRVLELGIGTGRIALPLAARGVKVAGIDASAAMVQKLREKPGGQDIPLTLVDI